MSRTGQPSSRDVEATLRAVAILDALAEGGELGTTDLARRTSISASTVSRQLGTLTRSGLVEHVPATGRYRLGVRVLRLANAVLGRLDLRDIARPHLEHLVHAVGETGTLSIPGDTDAITVDFVPTDRYLQGVTRLGRPSVGHASSAGKVMLAFGDVPAPPRPARRVHAQHDHRSGRAGRGDRARARAGLRRGGRGARARPERDRRPDLGRERHARRDRGAAGTDQPLRRGRPCARRCRSSSRAPSASRTPSAGTASPRTRRLTPPGQAVIGTCPGWAATRASQARTAG